MKKIFSTVLLVLSFFISTSSHGQTTISGGIFVNAMAVGQCNEMPSYTVYYIEPDPNLLGAQGGEITPMCQTAFQTECAKEIPPLTNSWSIDAEKFLSQSRKAIVEKCISQPNSPVKLPNGQPIGMPRGTADWFQHYQTTPPLLSPGNLAPEVKPGPRSIPLNTSDSDGYNFLKKIFIRTFGLAAFITLLLAAGIGIGASGGSDTPVVIPALILIMIAMLSSSYNQFSPDEKKQFDQIKQQYLSYLPVQFDSKTQTAIVDNTKIKMVNDGDTYRTEVSKVNPAKPSALDFMHSSQFYIDHRGEWVSESPAKCTKGHTKDRKLINDGDC